MLDEVLLSMEKQDIERAEKILAALDLLHMKELHPMCLSGAKAACGYCKCGCF